MDVPIESKREEFQSKQVLPVVGAHFIHDIYTSFVAPLLPELIRKLSLSLTQAGALTAILDLPAILNPFIGYLAEKISLRAFIILAPAVSGTILSSIGLVSDYYTLAVLFFATGISVAAFHAPAPAMISRVSGNRLGFGMSLFMAAGELARTLGPLLVTWLVSIWTLEGLYRAMFLGWVASAILYLQLRKAPAQTEKPANLREFIPFIKSLFLPITLLLLLRNLMVENLTTYLPTFMTLRGANLMLSGGALSLLEFAGVLGALSGGAFSDKIGRRKVLVAATILASGLTLVFIQLQGWGMIPVLFLLGFSALSTTPLLLALVQECLPNHRALGNGIFMFLSFLIRPFARLIIGMLGDRYGLYTSFSLGAWLSLLSIPVIYKLPLIGNAASEQ